MHGFRDGYRRRDVPLYSNLIKRRLERLGLNGARQDYHIEF